MLFCPRLVIDVPTLECFTPATCNVAGVVLHSFYFNMDLEKNELKLTFLCKIKAECAKQGYKEITDFFPACSAVFFYCSILP